MIAVKWSQPRHRIDSAQVQGRRTNIAVKEIVARNIVQADQSDLNDVREAWEKEATALGKLSEVKHDNLIQCIAAISRGDKYYFLFPWADGGSLRDFWTMMPNPKLSPEFVRQILVQLRGLAEALDKLHSYKGRVATYRQGSDAEHYASSGGGIRHGDLKPENILRFTPRDDNDIGTLKIADMGLAKHHEVNTRLRKNITSTKYGTARYEPPEVGAPRLTSPPTSRLYDVWSMGCIILELLIWLLHGNEKLIAFNDSIQGGRKDIEPPYYVVKEIVGQEKVAEVHPNVTRYINALAEDQACAANTALGDLLNVVKTKLLVVPLPPSSTADQDGPVSVTLTEPTETNNGQYRASANSLFKSLTDILQGETNHSYLYPGRNRPKVPIIPVQAAPSTTSSDNLHPDAAYDIATRPKVGPVTESLPRAVTQMRENVRTSFAIRPFSLCPAIWIADRRAF